MNQRLLSGAKPVDLLSASRGVLQRTCACGQHCSGGECQSCRQKRESGLQHANKNSGSLRNTPMATSTTVPEAASGNKNFPP